MNAVMFTATKLDGRSSDEWELIRSIRLSPIASIVTDARADDNPIIAANRQFEQLTRYSESELVGRNCRILAGPETQRAHSAALAHAVATAAPVVLKLLNYRKNGSKFLNAVMIAPVFDDQAELAYFVGSQMEVAAGQGDLLRASAAARVDQLTRQQQAVLRLMAKGMRNRQIGEHLGLTEKTIKMHRGGLVKRLGVSSTVEAMRLAIEAGF
ncbi:LuxR C-terminal-related transcriptional regulator [Sphingomonas sp. S1-29]|uniref:LuxR C-terminal-related transcriptional regulator n=1 Tax=Sphingomonas sp. S1-29 TaxID=2991074 RepID=UPI00223FAE50|nr:LuxR C-terminal-related transcriptional regulator [Sphingomonas sp. S1-29]UZK70471.1 LuxR C-terminal-related transcriptional regulator [Sphingomonas sp. S1-29]